MCHISCTKEQLRRFIGFLVGINILNAYINKNPSTIKNNIIFNHKEGSLPWFRFTSTNWSFVFLFNTVVVIRCAWANASTTMGILSKKRQIKWCCLYRVAHASALGNFHIWYMQGHFEWFLWKCVCGVVHICEIGNFMLLPSWSYLLFSLFVFL